jgi:hypothetical protein
MQLPRGTYLNIKRHTKVGALLGELHEVKYTGICTISFKTENCSVVFKSGKCILAQFQEMVGEAAWDQLQKILAEYVDAALSTLDEAQIQLSLEFNKNCRIGNVRKKVISPPEKNPELQSPMMKKFPVNPPTKPFIDLIKNHPKPVIPDTASFNKSGINEKFRSAEIPKILSDAQFRRAGQQPAGPIPQKSPINSHSQDEESKSDDSIPCIKDTDPSSFETDINTFETMDVESITNKIRGECETLIKQLQLEHLTDD